MKRHISVALVLTTTLLLLNTAIAQEIIKDKPTPSRAEWAPLGQAYGQDYSTSDVTKVVVIGSGTPAADTRHGGISVAVVVNGQPYIIDCGPGFWRDSQASTPAYGGKIAGLEPKNLTRLFLTHLHFDHTEGLSEFMLAPWIYYREGPLQVYGPPGTEDMVRHLTEAYTKDIDLQMFGLEQLNATGYILKAKDVLAGEVYKDNNVRITAYQNHHGTWDYTYAYRVVTSKPDGTVDRTIVFSGDTSLFDGMEEVYAGADILFHEAYSFDPKTNPYDAKAPVSVSYMNAFHTSTEQLAGVLKKVNPKVTVLYHYVTFTPANATRPRARCQGDQEVRLQRSRDSVAGRRHLLEGFQGGFGPTAGHAAAAASTTGQSQSATVPVVWTGSGEE
jgi:ribonuclease BN (tRNA processing enzyme)